MPTFGDLRSLLQQPPSESLWQEVSDMLTALRAGEQHEGFEEQVLPYCHELLARWPADIWREPPESWLERWCDNKWGDLADLCHTEVGSFYLYVRAAGSGSVVMSCCLWGSTFAEVRDAIDAFASSFGKDPEGADIDIDALWQNGHLLVTFWQGHAIDAIDLNNHWVFEKWNGARGLRASEGSFHEEWLGVGADGEEVFVFYDELFEGLDGASPGDVEARVAWEEITARPSRGTPQQAPITLTKALADRIESAAGFTLFESREEPWSPGRYMNYFG